jgi:hypothetical protein
VSVQPSTVHRSERHRVEGLPGPTHISRSYVERQNLRIRMSMRRFIGLTSAVSKKFDNNENTPALYFAFYSLAASYVAGRFPLLSSLGASATA